MNESMKKVDIATLKIGQPVYVSFHDTKGETGKNYDKRYGLLAEKGEYPRVLFLNIKDDRFVDPDALYYPPQITAPAATTSTPQPEQPVLIELEKLRDWLQHYDEFAPLNDTCKHFSDPTNQYHPQPATDTIQQAILWLRYNGMNESADILEQKGWNTDGMLQFAKGEEWVPEVGDEVRVSRTNAIVSLITDDKIRLTYSDGCISWAHQSDLTLIKKADKPHPNLPTYEKEGERWKEGLENKMQPEVDTSRVRVSSNSQHTTWKQQLNEPLKPFNLPTARKLYHEGGTGKELALQWYEAGQLTVPALPMKWEDLGILEGYYIDLDSQIESDYSRRAIAGAKGLFPTRFYVEAALATAQLLQLRKAWLEIECSDWVPDWSSEEQGKCIVERRGNILIVAYTELNYSPLSFPINSSLSERFLTAFPELLRTAFCLPNEGEGGV